MAWIPVALDAYQIIKGGQDQAAAEKYNSVVSAENAQIAKMRANLNVEEIAKQDRYTKGEQIAAYGGSGVRLTGSPMDELAFQSINDHFKQQVAKFNGLVNVGADQASSNLSSFMEGQYTRSSEINAGSRIGSYLIDKYYSPSSIPPNTTTGSAGSSFGSSASSGTYTSPDGGG